MIQELIDFISSTIAGGIMGNAAYDGLKKVLGSNFEKLSSFIKNDEKEKFEGALEILLENKTLKAEILALKNGKLVDGSLNKITNSHVDVKLGKSGTMSKSINKVKNSTIKIK
ncbi:MAG TPA: hypothetical protein EYH01_08450 [Campylobacterales bacterium]|nr:hypothetical protein [Campylobacterales bacterium]